MALAAAAALALVGALDYFYQRFRHEQSLRMTRQELKDEIKREEGDPQLRARIRRMQREMSKRQMLQKVPRATTSLTLEQTRISAGRRSSIALNVARSES